VSYESAQTCETIACIVGGLPGHPQPRRRTEARHHQDGARDRSHTQNGDTKVEIDLRGPRIRCGDKAGEARETCQKFALRGLGKVAWDY